MELYRPPEPVRKMPAPEPETVYIEQQDAVEQMVAPPEEPDKNDMSDLFEVPSQDDNDMAIDHLFELDEEEDLGDLVDVSREDITGYAPEPQPQQKPRYRINPKARRVVRREPPPTSLGGMR